MSPISFILLLTLLALTSSTPTLSPRQTPLPQQYYLRTSLVDATNDIGTPKDNLYIRPYHIGAGLSDVTLTPNVSTALAGYLNTTLDPNSGESTWITNITSLIANNETLYWDLCAVETPYGNWGTMTIDLGNYACDTFYADGDLLVFALGGWLVCDWWHGVPQLFFIMDGDTAEEDAFQVPSSCSVVDLQMVQVGVDGNVDGVEVC